MMRDREVLGVVGARSGSTGVPDKNIRPLAGKPLLAWIVEAARESRTVSRIVVSTDSQRYAAVARQWGAEVPFLRPEALAQNLSPEYEYVRHALSTLEQTEGYRPDIVVRLMPTVPLQSADDIDACVRELCREPHPDSVVAIAEARQHPMKALKLVEDPEGPGQRLVTYFDETGRGVTPIARQNYAPAYFRANLIACWRSVVFETASLTGDYVRHHFVPQERAVDIDSVADFKIAEALLLGSLDQGGDG